jgi:hypothetical protein
MSAVLSSVGILEAKVNFIIHQLASLFSRLLENSKVWGQFQTPNKELAITIIMRPTMINKWKHGVHS